MYYILYLFLSNIFYITYICITYTMNPHMIYVYSWMGCRQDLHICNSQQQEIGLAASPNMYYVIVYPVRNA